MSLATKIRKHFIFSQSIPFQLPTLARISSSVRPDSSKAMVIYSVSKKSSPPPKKKNFCNIFTCGEPV